MKKIFCCPALELFCCLPLWKTVLFVSSRAFLLSTPTFLLSTPVENSEATWKKATKCNKWIFFFLFCVCVWWSPKVQYIVVQCCKSAVDLSSAVYQLSSKCNLPVPYLVPTKTAEHLLFLVFPLLCNITILFVTSVHQNIFTKPRIFFNKIWCYESFNGAVKCILIPPQDLEKVGWFQSRKKNICNYVYINRYLWIGELVNWCHKQDM